MSGKPFHHKGWHSRGYLPHLDAAGEIQALTFRLADAVPAKVVDHWLRELEQVSRDLHERRSRLLRMIARYEDAGHGDCLLADGRNAEIVENALLHFDDERYRLIEWCIMPNHVHVLMHCNFGGTLGEIVKSWKTFTARAIHRERRTEGALWARDYFDRYMRDADHLADSRNYIRQNPVKAKLCETPEAWRWSSAWAGRTASL